MLESTTASLDELNVASEKCFDLKLLVPFRSSQLPTIHVSLFVSFENFSREYLEAFWCLSGMACLDPPENNAWQSHFKRFGGVERSPSIFCWRSSSIGQCLGGCIAGIMSMLVSARELYLEADRNLQAPTNSASRYLGHSAE